MLKNSQILGVLIELSYFTYRSGTLAAYLEKLPILTGWGSQRRTSMQRNAGG